MKQNKSIKSSKLSLKFANTSKILAIEDFIENYHQLVTDDIVLDGVETIVIDDTIFDTEYTGTTAINASLVAQYTIPVTVTRRPTPE